MVTQYHDLALFIRDRCQRELQFPIAIIIFCRLFRRSCLVRQSFCRYITRPSATQQIDAPVSNYSQEPRFQWTFLCIVCSRLAQHCRKRILYGIGCIVRVAKDVRCQCVRASSQTGQLVFYLVYIHALQYIYAPVQILFPKTRYFLPPHRSSLSNIHEFQGCSPPLS